MSQVFLSSGGIKIIGLNISRKEKPIHKFSGRKNKWEIRSSWRNWLFALPAIFKKKNCLTPFLSLPRFSPYIYFFSPSILKTDFPLGVYTNTTMIGTHKWMQQYKMGHSQHTIPKQKLPKTQKKKMVKKRIKKSYD